MAVTRAQTDAFAEFAGECAKETAVIFSKAPQIDESVDTADLQQVKTDIVNSVAAVYVLYGEKLEIVKSVENLRRDLSSELDRFKLLANEYIGKVDYIVNARKFGLGSSTVVAQAQLPALEPQCFSGDFKDYHLWASSFKTLVTDQISDEKARLFYLSKYLRGEARDMVSIFLNATAPNSFDQAWNKLADRYGDSFALGNLIIRDLENQPKIAPNDPKALRIFSDKIQQALSQLNSLPTLKYLNVPSENCKIIQKLPVHLFHSWRRIVYEVKKGTGNYPDFKRFAEFVEQESEICNEISLAHINPRSDGKPDNKGARTGSSPKHFTSHKTRANFDEPCLCCGLNNHDLPQCRRFLKCSVSEVNKLVSEKRLCRGCLKPGHYYAKCSKPLVCDKCNSKHPTALHASREAYLTRNDLGDQLATPGNSSGKTEEKPKKDPVTKPLGNSSGIQGGQANTTLATNTEVSRVQFAPILPVRISHKSNPSKYIDVYCCIDCQSNTSFVTDEVLDSLGIKGTTTHIKLATMLGSTDRIECKQVGGLQLSSPDGSKQIGLPYVFSRKTIPADRSHIPTRESVEKFPHLREIKSKLPSSELKLPIGILVGYDCTALQNPLEIKSPRPGSTAPFGIKYALGWSVIGTSPGAFRNSGTSNFTVTSHKILTYSVGDLEGQSSHEGELVVPRPVHVDHSIDACIRALEDEVVQFNDKKSSENQALSVQDAQFFSQVSNFSRDSSGQYTFPLPFNGKISSLQLNTPVALKRLNSLKSRLVRNPDLCAQYVQSMNELESEGFSVKVTDPNLVKWIIPHQAVLSKNKLRVVFDASSQYQGLSLNDCLLQGPDINNPLLQVLTKFRMNKVALSCDIRKMYYNFHVPESDSYYLCYYWWTGGDFTKQPTLYRMRVHSFGLRSAPSTCIYGLKQIAQESQSESVKEFLSKDFYVDDGLSSFSTVKEAVSVANSAIKLCKESNLFLHKFRSNCPEVIVQIEQPGVESFSESDPESVQISDTGQKILGLLWDVEKDEFFFQYSPEKFEVEMTMRGLLSANSSIFDPLGFLSPFILYAKLVLQAVVSTSGRAWDEPISEECADNWHLWKNSLKNLFQFKIQRCLINSVVTYSGSNVFSEFQHPSKNFSSVENSDELESVSLHAFGDASNRAYGVTIYLVSKFRNKTVSNLVLAKSKVAPSKNVLSVPRLELLASVLCVKWTNKILDFFSGVAHREPKFHLSATNVHYYSDSKVVLGYIYSQTRRFTVFVANRVSYIHTHTQLSQWHYVSTSENPADIASRPKLLDEFSSVWQTWLSGPTFLVDNSFSDECIDPNALEQCVLDSGELKPGQQCVSFATDVHVVIDFWNEIFLTSPTWRKLVNFISVWLCVSKLLKTKRPKNETTIDSQILENAQCLIVHKVQFESFPTEFMLLEDNNPIPRHSVLYKLDVYIDNEMPYPVIRVGGRIKNSSLSDIEKHPIVLPYKHKVSQLLAEHAHTKCYHMGRNFTLAKIRQCGFWIIGSKRLVSSLIHQCIQCRKLRAEPQIPKMANLPVSRTELVGPAFSHIGCDLFGYFQVKQGRALVKRWVLLCTCMSSRAVHLEVVHSLSSDSLILALRRFQSIRGPIKSLTCDCGTNFVGACTIIQSELKKIVDPKVKKFLIENGANFEWRFNPPHASHFGGAFERMIRTCRAVLISVLDEFSGQLSDEIFRTVLCEVTGIVNSRPLCLDANTDPNDPQFLSPINLLTWKSKVIIPPLAIFQEGENYLVKYWRKTQHLANQFWSKFRVQYYNILQVRQKWQQTQRQLKVGDIVLEVRKEAPRNSWPMARVMEVIKSQDGIVRTVKIKVGDNLYTRPVAKCIYLFEANNV